jgi:hypothetical protein
MAMKPAFTSKPLSSSMVTEPCEKPNCVDMLCVECGWTGHCEPQDAPWPVFQQHNCKLRTESISMGD